VRIGLLTTSFPRTAQDVPGIFVRGFAESLVAQGHEVEVLAPEPGESTYESPPRIPGVRVHWVPYLRPRRLERTFYGAGVLDNLRASPRAWLGPLPFSLSLYAHAATRVGRWDALVSHWALPSGLIAAAVRGKRPHLAVMHSADVFLLERLPGRLQLARRLLHGASEVVCVSRELRQRLLQVFPPLERAEHAPKVHACPMGIEPTSTPQEPRADLRAGLGLARFTALCLCRLIPLKGIQHVIDAVKMCPEVTLVVAGEGPARKALQARAAALGARVRFVGEVHGGEKSAWFWAADAFLSASIVSGSGRTEGMPTVLLEAMAHGLPVVATDVGGVCDLLRSGENALLVPPGNPAGIASALHALQSDAALRERLADNAREVAAQFTWPVLGPHFAALLTGGAFP
jgi:glycosyltransferase involved in cell wall biosynthesis